MAETGLLLEVRWEWDGTELAADAVQGADTISLLDPFALTVGDTIWLGQEPGENPYEIVTIDMTTGNATITPVLLVAFDEGTAVVPDVGGQPGKVWVAEVLLPDADEPIEVPLTVHDLSVMPEQVYDPPIAITISDDLRSVIDLPGNQPRVSGSWVSPIGLPPAEPTEAPAVSPVPDVFGTVDSLVVTTDPDAVAPGTTVDYHISLTEDFEPSSSTLAISSPSNVVMINVLPDGTPLSLDATYYLKTVAHNIIGSAPASISVPAALNADRVSSVAAARVIAGFILAGGITVGNITIDPVNGITIAVPGGSIRLPADGATPASFDGDVTARRLSIIDNYAISGSGQLNGTFTLKSGIAKPSESPTMYYDWPSMRLDAASWGKGLSPVLTGVNVLSKGVPDPSCVVTALTFFGGVIRILNPITGQMGWYPDPTSPQELGPNYNFGSPTPAWWSTAGEGTSSPAAVHHDSFQGLGPYIEQIAIATGAENTVSLTRRLPVVPHAYYRFQPWVRHTVTRETQSLLLSVEWRDASNALIGSVYRAAQVIPANTWVKADQLLDDAPANAAWGLFTLEWNVAASASVVGNQQPGDAYQVSEFSVRTDFSWTDGFYPYGGIATDQNRKLYWLYGSDSKRSGGFYWYAIRGDTMQKVGEVYSAALSLFPAGTYPKVACYGDTLYMLYHTSGGNLVLQTRTLGAAADFTMPAVGGPVNSSTINTNSQRPEIGALTVGPFDGPGTLCVAWSLRTSGSGSWAVRSAATPTATVSGLGNFLRAGADIVDGGCWHPALGRFLHINGGDGTGRVWHYSKFKVNTTVRAEHSWFDPKNSGTDDWYPEGLGDGSDGTHETQAGPYKEFLVQCRSWLNIEIPSPPDAEDNSGNRHIADAARIYIGEGSGTRYRLDTVGRSITQRSVRIDVAPIFDELRGPNRLAVTDADKGKFNFFTPDDVGAIVTGTNIPAGTVITGLVTEKAGQAVTLNQNHTATPGGQTITAEITRTALGRKVYQIETIPTFGPTSPLTNSFDLTPAVPGVILSTAEDVDGPLIELSGDGSGRLGPYKWDKNGDQIEGDPTYDTGWLSVASPGNGDAPFASGGSPSLTYRKIGKVVMVRFMRESATALDGSSSSGNFSNRNLHSVPLPVGFRPAFTTEIPARFLDAPQTVVVGTAGILEWLGGVGMNWPAGSSLRVEGMFLTD